MRSSKEGKALNAEVAEVAVENQVAPWPATANESRRVAAVACHRFIAF